MKNFAASTKIISVHSLTYVIIKTITANTNLTLLQLYQQTD